MNARLKMVDVRFMLSARTHGGLGRVPASRDGSAMGRFALAEISVLPVIVGFLDPVPASWDGSAMGRFALAEISVLPVSGGINRPSGARRAQLGTPGIVRVM